MKTLFSLFSHFIFVLTLTVFCSCGSYVLSTQESETLTISYVNGRPTFTSQLDNSVVSFNGDKDRLILSIVNLSSNKVNFNPNTDVFILTERGKRISPVSSRKYTKRLKTAATLNAFSSGLNYGTGNYYQGRNTERMMNQNLSDISFAYQNYLDLTTLASKSEPHTGFVEIKNGGKIERPWYIYILKWEKTPINILFTLPNTNFFTIKSKFPHHQG